MEIARGNVICLIEDSEKSHMQMRNLLCCKEVDFPWVYHYSSLMSQSSDVTEVLQGRFFFFFSIG